MAAGASGTKPPPSRADVERMIRGYRWMNRLAAVLLLAFALLFLLEGSPIVALVFVGALVLSLLTSVPAIRRLEANLLSRVQASERGEAPAS